VDHWFKEEKRDEVEAFKVGDAKPLWERDGAFLAATCAYFIAMVLFVGVRIAGGLGWFGLLADEVGEQATDIIVNVLIQIVIFLLVPMIVFGIFARQPLGKTLSDIGFNRPSRKVIGHSFLLGLLFYFLNMFIAALAIIVLVVLGYRLPVGDAPSAGMGGLLIGLLMIGVLPGLCEEVSNRGVMMRGFMPKLGVWRAVLLSSLIFGLMHMNIMQAVYASIMGILIALAILTTRSIWTGIIIHFMNNAIGVFISHAQNNDWLVGDLFNQLFDLFSGPGGFIIYFGFIFLVYVAIMNILHSFARETYKASEKEHFAMFLKNNPERVKAMINEGRIVSLEDMSRTVDAYVANISKMKAIRFYLEGQRKPKKLSAFEKTMVFGMVFLTGVVTVMTLVWGLM